MIEIDGSYGEAGGQIIRTSLGLSVLTGKPFKITKIRANRPNPGLQVQHLETLRAISQLCNAEVKGDGLGSTEVYFKPNKIEKDRIEIKLKTAASVGLVLQSLMIACLSSKKEILIKINGGATNGKWAAPANYQKCVIAELLKKMNYDIDIEIKKYGYFPKGGAEIHAKIKPAKIKSIVLENSGKVKEIFGFSHASVDLKKAEVAERQKNTAEKILDKYKTKIDAMYVDSLSTGSAVEIFAKTENTIFGSEGLGEKGKKAEDVGKFAAKKIIEEINSGACVDEYAEDQILPYMAIAGKSRVTVPKISSHTKTNIWLIEKFIPVKFSIDEEKKIISC